MKLLTALEARALMPTDPEVDSILTSIKDRAQNGFGFIDWAIRRENYSSVYRDLHNLGYKFDRPWDYSKREITTQIFRISW